MLTRSSVTVIARRFSKASSRGKLLPGLSPRVLASDRLEKNLENMTTPKLEKENMQSLGK